MLLKINSNLTWRRRKRGRRKTKVERESVSDRKERMNKTRE